MLVALLATATTCLADTAKEIESSNQRRHEFCMERKLGPDWWKYATVNYRNGQADPTPEQQKNRRKFDIAEKECSRG